MELQPERRVSSAEISFPERRKNERQSLYPRLTEPEDELLECLTTRLDGITKAQVLEEALRRYLPTINCGRAFTRRAMPDKPAVRRHYKLRRDIMDALQKVCRTHGWRQNEVVRHALIELGETAKGQQD